MINFSANLGFLWTDLALQDRVKAAAQADFQAVEFHFPYDTPAKDLRKALGETQLNPISLNTIRGKAGSPDFGLCALPDRQIEARAAIDQALSYASDAGIPKIHIMAGLAQGNVHAEQTFIDNLRYALERASADQTILIEPINRRDAPGYFLGTLDEALHIQDRVGDPRLKIMFDCYHMQVSGGDLLARFARHIERIGHVQFASVPARNEPDRGEVDYNWLLPAMQDAGYAGSFGAEYQPRGDTQEGLGWMKTFD